MRVLGFAAVAVLAVPGCLGGPPHHDPIIASFYPMEFLAARIAGPHLSVGVLIPSDVEPHEYDLKPSDLVRVQHARLFVYHGVHLEAFADRVVATAHDAGVATVAASDGIPTRAGQGEARGADPHLWIDPFFAQREAYTIEAAIERIDPANTTDYLRRVDALTGDLDRLDRAYADGLAHCAKPKIITTHDAFGYLAARYHFTQYAITGFEPDAEPSPAKVHEVADLARRENITTIFFETLVSPKVADVVAREIHGRTAVLDPVEGLAPADARAGRDYFTLMRANLANLRDAMGCP